MHKAQYMYFEIIQNCPEHSYNVLSTKIKLIKIKTIKLTSKRYVRGFMGEYLRYYRLCNYSLVYFVFAK